MKTSFALFLVAALAACATQSNTESEPAPAPAPSASSPRASTAPATRAGPSASAAATPRGGNAMPQARSVYYEYDKAEIKADDAKLVDAHAQYLRQHPELKVKVEGNADERGSAEYNLALGQRRADAVMKRMNILGIPGERIETVSFGKEKPKAGGHDETSWSENRRSDIVYR